MNYSQFDTLERPKAVVGMPRWPGALKAIELAQYGAKEKPAIALGGRFPDGSELILEYQLHRMYGIPNDLYEQVGEPPLLSVLVVDNGVGILRTSKLVVGGRKRAHMAEHALQEIHKLLGDERPIGVMAASIDETASRRRYFFRCQ